MNNRISVEELFKDPKKNNDIIFEQFKSLVYDIALKKYQLPNNRDREEIISEGFIGLQKAINSFDVTRSNKFISYAYCCIINEINMYFRRNNRCYRSTGHNLIYFGQSILNTNDGDLENITVSDRVDDTIDYEGEIVEKMMADLVCKKLLNRLSEQDKVIIKMYYLEEKTQKEISDFLGITQSAISRKIKKAVKKIKNMSEVNMNG